MKRIFVAIPITEELPPDLARDFRQVKEIRWIEPKNLHVTLVPPWYAQEAPLAAKLLGEGDSIPDIIKKLKTLEGKVPAFDMEFKRIGFGPNPRQPRVIWATGEANETISAKGGSASGGNNLQLTINQVLEREMEDRPFKLHVTLARFRSEDFKKLPIKELDEQISWKQKVESFMLMESHLSSQGADYEVLETIKLG